MRKFLLLAIAGAFVTGQVNAQDSTKTKKKDWSKVNMSSRPNDHFMVQIGYDGWTGQTDSINIKGLSRHFNFYGMYDLAFKSNPQFSVAGGIGLGTSGIFFKNTAIDIANKAGAGKATFENAEKAAHFKKLKLSTVYLEVPIELRWVSNPLQSAKSYKVALGVKVGTLIDGHTKGKNLLDATGASQYGSKYILKEKDKQFFNNIRLAGTLRFGYGPFTLYGAYQINTLFKEGRGPEVRPYSVGLCLAGL